MKKLHFDGSAFDLPCIKININYSLGVRSVLIYKKLWLQVGSTVRAFDLPFIAWEFGPCF